jgi:O-antigen ligase
MRSGAVPSRAALLLAGLVAAVPWLVPVHGLPIPSFHDEWLGAALLLVLAVLLGLDRTARFALPRFVPWLVALAIVFALHASSATYPQIPLAWAAYALLAALAGVAGRTLAADLGEAAVVRVLAWACAFAAVVNALVTVLQVFGVPEVLRDLVAVTDGGRAVGQVGQPNILATFLMAGLASVLWLRMTGARGAGLAIVAAVVIAYGAALCGSRLVLLHAGVLVVAALAGVRGGLSRRFAGATVVAALLVVAAQFAVGPLHAALGLPVPVTGVDRAQTALVADGATLGFGARAAAWRATLDVVGDAPWIGVGPGTLAAELFARGLPDAMAREGEVWQSAHNVFLDVAAAGGVAGVALLAAALLAWWLPTASALFRRASPALWWTAAVAGVITVHALLEAPLSYAHVLVLLAFVMGLVARTWTRPGTTPLRVATLVVAPLLLVVAGRVLVDYQQLDRVRYSAQASFLGADDRAADRAVLAALGDGPLAPMADLWRFTGTPWTEAEAPAAIALGVKAAEFRPAFVVVAKQAALLAVAGYDPQAEALVDLLVATAPWKRERINAVLADADPGDHEAIARLRQRVAAVASLPGPR